MEPLFTKPGAADVSKGLIHIILKAYIVNYELLSSCLYHVMSYCVHLGSIFCVTHKYLQGVVIMWS